MTGQTKFLIALGLLFILGYYTVSTDDPVDETEVGHVSSTRG